MRLSLCSVTFATLIEHPNGIEETELIKELEKKVKGTYAEHSFNDLELFKMRVIKGFIEVGIVKVENNVYFLNPDAESYNEDNLINVLLAYNFSNRYPLKKHNT